MNRPEIGDTIYTRYDGPKGTEYIAHSTVLYLEPKFLFFTDMTPVRTRSVYPDFKPGERTENVRWDGKRWIRVS